MAFLAGWTQERRKPGPDGPWVPLEPAALLARLGRRLVGAEPVDLVACVRPYAWSYADLAGDVAARLGVPAAESITADHGGNSPVAMLGEVARRLETGEARTALVLGCETMHSRRLARREGVWLDWTPRPETRADTTMATDLEARHGIWEPVGIFSVIDHAFRHRVGRSRDGHRRRAAQILARNAAVSADNPFAWFGVDHDADTIATPTPDNRMVADPHTKLMCAVMDVDQGAGLLLTAEPEGERPVRIASVAGAHDAHRVVHRPEIGASPGMAEAAETALAAAGVGADEVDAFDLYSCFPVAVELAAEALGLDPVDDPRPLTMTGGLAYAGGPGNAYALHALAAAGEAIATGRFDTVAVSGIGMACSKHDWSVLTAGPGSTEVADHAGTVGSPVEEAPDRGGPGRVAGYTVLWDRAGPTRSVFYLDLPGGRRTVANGPDDAEWFGWLEAHDPMGAEGTVEVGATNLFRPGGTHDPHRTP
jgi:acetyl-CoA C-acetyltransferase